MQVFGEWAQVEVVELVNDGGGLAFGIVGGRSSGVLVKSVLPGGVADRDGRLRSGDMLLRIGAVCVVGMCARQAAAVLRQCGACVRLLVARPAHSGTAQQQPSLGASPAPVVPTRLLADPLELERGLAEAGHEGFGALCDPPAPDLPQPPTIIEERLHHRPVASIVAVVPRGALAPSPRPPPLIAAPEPPPPQPPRLPLDMAVRGGRGGSPETLSYEVALSKDAAGLGITVAGYVCEQEELSGIFVKSISEGSSADLCGKIQVNDRIVEVDGVSLHGVTNHRAVALLRDAKGPIVRLKALRYLRGAGFERLQRALAAQDGRRLPVAPPSPSVTSLARYSFSVYDESTVIEPEPESGRHVSPTSPRSPASPTSPDEEIVIGAAGDGDRRVQDKWRDILAAEPDWPGHCFQYEVIVGTIMKEKDSGLGISLEGTVRVVGGREVGARHYIRAIAPRSPVARLGLYRVGDELLEVNGWRVLGAHHVEVVSRLRAVTSPVSLVVVRKLTEPLPNSNFARNSVVGGSLQELLAAPQRLIKAKSESSVASLCSATTVMSAPHDHDEFCSDELERGRSRSLEPLSGLAMWSDQVEYIQLLKEDRGLGFSILDYLDPMEAGSSVIVVRSVVRGGAAAAHGRLAPGDRLVSVNGVDVARSPLAVAVNAIKSAPKGLVTIGITKPLPCSTVVGGERANGPSVQSSQRLEYFTKLLRLIMSLHRDIMALQRCPEYRVPSIAAQECVNSLASDDHTGMDSFHECLQEYAEGLEVVQICLEPEESSIKDEELSALADLSYEENLKNHTLVDSKVYIETKVHEKVNGISEMKSFKSDDSLDDPDDDLTITENDVITLPRELSRRTSLIKNEEDKSVLKQQSKDLSTSDEMVFAVTPTGLERISFETYWKDSEVIRENKKNDESWTLNSPSDETSSFYDATARISIQEQNNSLLYIDHEIDGYETCLDDDSSSAKCPEKNGRKSPIKELDKHDKIAIKNVDPRAKTIEPEPVITIEEAPEYTRPYVEEHIIKQMKSLRIEPLNVNVSTKKRRKSPTKPAKTERRCVEYYNDQEECLQEIQRRKRREEEQRTRGEDKRKEKFDIKKLNSHKKDPSEESTDADTYVPGCHKCFLEHAYAITQAYIAEATACKYCEVIRDMLEVPKSHYRRKSAPALFNVDSPGSETEDENFLTVPEVKDRRQSAGPLKYLVPARRSSYVGGMTVSGHKEGGQRWGPPRRVTLRRRPGAPLGVSIVGGKVDIIANHGGENGERGMFGIFIKNVVPDSPAAQCGELQVGDRILEVDGVDVRTAQHERAVQLIKAAKDDVTLTVQSLVAWKSDSSDVDSSPPAPAQTRPNKTRSMKAKAPKPPPQQHDIKITVTPDTDDKKEEKKETEAQGESEKAASDTAPEKPKPAYSDSDSSDEEDEREMQGRTYSDKGVEIDRASAGAIKRSREEREADPEEEDDFGYTTNKIRKKYASLGDNVVVVKLERVGQIGLGLSLAGHRDRSRMAVFVCGLNPAGAAIAAQPPVKVGDEILEVNGIVLHGRCHLNASAIIKGLVGPVFKFILLRRKAALEDVAVKPLTQFPTPLEEGLDDRFAGYKGVRDITVKKGPAGLGIMIIEGRHTEAGRGIFVSDLQEGSAAEQAGLNIGDMILAVNRDSLLSCTYDSAAAKLKQTEGVVILTVCSPNLKDGETPEDRPKTPQPAVSPAKPEPPADPATAAVRANADTVIEITTNNEVIGLSLLGGNDTLIAGAVAIVLEVYKEGAIAKDGRIKVGDQIKNCNGVEITKDMSNERICLIIKQKAPKLKMTVYRPEPLQYDEVETELTRKSGRPLGLNCVAPLEGPGLYLGEILPGSPAEVDGKLQRGDWLVSVDGKDVSALEPVAAAAILKLAGNKVPVKVKRFKPIR